MKNFFQKTKLELESYIFNFLIKFSLILNWPKFTAVIFALGVKKFNHQGKYKVLCMRRSIFMDDVRAMAEFSGQIRYVVLGRNYFQMILDYFTPESEKGKIMENNYHVSEYGQEGKKKYYQYLKKMFPTLKRLVGFDAILCANFGYTEQQELAKLCRDYHFPLIVLFKEGMVAPGTHVDWTKKAHENFQFNQTKMLVYNCDILEGLVAAEIPGLTRDKIEVVGIPRVDYYFKPREKVDGNKQVVFFSTYFHDKLIYLADDKEKCRQLMKKFDDFHRFIMEFASCHPDIKVIIKTKLSQHFLEYVQGIFKENFKTNIPNLVITNIGNPIDLIRGSDTVIGFGSTTLIEALVANKTIINLDFSGFLSNISFDYFRISPGLANYVKTKEELEEIILNYKKYRRYDNAQRKEFLEKFFHILDGQASVRAEQAIIQTIKEYNN